MRTQRWPAATVLALCIVAALMGAGLSRQRAAETASPNPWVLPQ